MPDIDKININNVVSNLGDEGLRNDAQEVATIAQQNINRANIAINDTQGKITVLGNTETAQENQLAELENKSGSAWESINMEIQGYQTKEYIPIIQAGETVDAQICEYAILIPYRTSTTGTLELINGQVSLNDMFLFKIPAKHANKTIVQNLTGTYVMQRMNIQNGNLTTFFNVRKDVNADGTIDFVLTRTADPLPAQYTAGQQISIMYNSQLVYLWDLYTQGTKNILTYNYMAGK